MKSLMRAVLVLTILASPSLAAADDLTGANRILCTAVQATRCVDSGDCEIDLPWNMNIPQFIEVDLTAKKLSTTKASGENRSTPIGQLLRQDGMIVIQGFEKGRAFSFVITQETGDLSAAVAASGKAVAVFGACTPMPVSR
jgi:hypothetical protein